MFSNAKIDIIFGGILLLSSPMIKRRLKTIVNAAAVTINAKYWLNNNVSFVPPTWYQVLPVVAAKII